MDLSSDSEDCQLYTRTAENIRLKRKNLQAELEDFKKVKNLFPCEKEDLNGNQTKISKSDEKFLLSSSESDDEVPLSVRFNKEIAFKTSKPKTTRAKSIRPNRNKNVKKRKRTPKSSSPVVDVIVLDDDSGYPTVSMTPIDFKKGRNRKNKISEVCTTNISLTSICSVDSDDESFDSSNTVTLSVEWHNGLKITRKEFKVRKYQKLETIFEELAKLEDIPTSRVLLMHDFNFIKPTDTPSSLNFKFYGALTGSVSNSDVNHYQLNMDSSNQKANENAEGCISVKMQIETRQTLVLKIKKHQKVRELFLKCAEELKCDENKIKLTFDGECLEPNDLLSDLDVEDGDIFHVYVKS